MKHSDRPSRPPPANFFPRETKVRQARLLLASNKTLLQRAAEKRLIWKSVAICMRGIQIDASFARSPNDSPPSPSPPPHHNASRFLCFLRSGLNFQARNDCWRRVIRRGHNEICRRSDEGEGGRAGRGGGGREKMNAPFVEAGATRGKKAAEKCESVFTDYVSDYFFASKTCIILCGRCCCCWCCFEIRCFWFRVLRIEEGFGW